MYNKHFKPGQKVLIHSASPDRGEDRIENFSACCQSVENGILTLSLPYRADTSLFAAGNRLSVVSESLGLGLKAQAFYHNHIGRDVIQLRFDGHLQFFQIRPAERINLPIGIRYTRSTGDLQEVRQQWQQNIHRLANTPPGSLPKLPCGMVNLSSGGIRLGFKTPIDKAQLCLLLMQIEPDDAPICTVAEVVWSHGHGSADTCMAGLQFTAIMAEDQKRLEKFIRTARMNRQKKPVPPQ
ncbi:MAG: PilZ domain-containing protein [Syntrophotalea acetylenica]|uniref:PilZ domain-containing protein n=1 Tax=Syntrophotalea sp. TaxID=2812029 RepID=UPI003D09A901|nr:PilZ domain-containing protein [Syntrophotalea acetylenica]